MRRVALIPFLLLALSASALAGKAHLLVYKVWEPGIGSYLNRVIVTPEFVRLDEGSDGGGFTLYDRDSEVIYNVNTADRSVLVLDPPHKMPKASRKLVLTEETKADAEAPLIGGKQPVFYRLKTNGKVCVDIVAVQGVMKDAVEGVRDFNRILAFQQGVTINAMPDSTQSDCDLSEFVFHTERKLSYGLIIQEMRERMRRSLIDFKEEFDASPQLFEIPKGYGRMTVPTPKGL